MKLAIGNDHTAVELKREVQAHLEEQGYEVVNVGTDSPDRFNYPVSGYKVAEMVASGEVDGGILICGTGIGMSMAANKVKGIRAACCSDHFSAKYTRLHNDANIICMGGRVIGAGVAVELVDLFLHTEFEGGRHQVRIAQIAAIENGEL